MYCSGFSQKEYSFNHAARCCYGFVVALYTKRILAIKGNVVKGILRLHVFWQSFIKTIYQKYSLSIDTPCIVTKDVT